MNPLSFLMQPTSAVLISGGISSKTGESHSAQSRSFVVSMDKNTVITPAIIAAPVGSSTAATLYNAQEIAQTDATSPARSAEDRFLELMDKSPEELLREQILKELGYTEEQLAGMSPEDRLKAEEDIRQRLIEKIEQAMREKGIDATIGKASLAQSVTA